MDISFEKKRYHVWFEYLIRTPYYRLLCEELDCIESRTPLPHLDFFTPAVTLFEEKYSWWWGDTDLRLFTFEDFWKKNKEVVFNKKHSGDTTRFKRLAKGRRFGQDQFETYLRRVWFYQLYVIQGWSGSKILTGDFPSYESCPYGNIIISSSSLERAIKRNHEDRLNRGDFSFLSRKRGPATPISELLKKDIQRAKKTISAVQSGWFPDQPLL